MKPSNVHLQGEGFRDIIPEIKVLASRFAKGRSCPGVLVSARLIIDQVEKHDIVETITGTKGAKANFFSTNSNSKVTDCSGRRTRSARWVGAVTSQEGHQFPCTRS